VISLAGLTLLGLAFVPGFEIQSPRLIKAAVVMLWAHTLYSDISIYKMDLRYIFFHNPKRFAVMLGSASHAILLCFLFGYLPVVAALYGGLGLGVLHFILMESKGGGMQVRPFAYLSLVVAGVALSSRKILQEAT